jgi:hypothetical protein
VGLVDLLGRWHRARQRPPAGGGAPAPAPAPVEPPSAPPRPGGHPRKAPVPPRSADAAPRRGDRPPLGRRLAVEEVAAREAGTRRREARGTPAPTGRRPPVGLDAAQARRAIVTATLLGPCRALDNRAFHP